MNFRDTLADVMESDMYLDAPTDDARVLILNTIKKKFDQGAKAFILYNDEDLLGKIEAKKEKQAIKLLGEDR